MTIWPRVQPASMLKVVAAVPVVTPFSAAGIGRHGTPCLAGDGQIRHVGLHNHFPGFIFTHRRMGRGRGGLGHSDALVGDGFTGSICSRLDVDGHRRTGLYRVLGFISMTIRLFVSAIAAADGVMAADIPSIRHTSQVSPSCFVTTTPDPAVARSRQRMA